MGRKVRRNGQLSPAAEKRQKRESTIAGKWTKRESRLQNARKQAKSVKKRVN